MANFVVWLDSAHAKVFELHPTRVEEKSLKRHEVHHHKSIEKEHNNHKNLDKFFHELAGKLTTAHEILVVGPGEAKTLFKKHLELHHHDQINRKVVGLETVDHPTDGQIIALAKKFFKAHLAFE